MMRKFGPIHNFIFYTTILCASSTHTQLQKQANIRELGVFLPPPGQELHLPLCVVPYCHFVSTLFGSAFDSIFHTPQPRVQCRFPWGFPVVGTISVATKWDDLWGEGQQLLQQLGCPHGFHSPFCGTDTILPTHTRNRIRGACVANDSQQNCQTQLCLATRPAALAYGFVCVTTHAFQRAPLRLLCVRNYPFA